MYTKKQFISPHLIFFQNYCIDSLNVSLDDNQNVNMPISPLYKVTCLLVFFIYKMQYLKCILSQIVFENTKTQPLKHLKSLLARNFCFDPQQFYDNFKNTNSRHLSHAKKFLIFSHFFFIRKSA